MIGKYQWLTIFIALLVGVTMFFGFSIKKPDLEQIETKRVLNRIENSEPVLISRAEKDLSPDQTDLIHTIRHSIEKSEGDGDKIKNLKELAGKWFDYGYPVISAIYAKQAAELENNAEAWAIAGSTSYIALRKAKNDTERDYAGASAIQCYENAISLDVSNISYRVNLALTYVEYPPAGDPMKGILILLEMEKEYPENPLILRSLAELSVKTGQYDKAVDRLEKIVELNSHDRRAWCLLVETYKQLSVSTDRIEMANRYCHD